MFEACGKDSFDYSYSMVATVFFLLVLTEPVWKWTTKKCKGGG